ncbi:MAG: hypothetical protein EZS28_027495, partial [Streblomastix strix]
LGLKKQEITKEEFESIAQNYAVQYKIQNQHELQNHSKVVLQGFREAYLMMYRTGTLNARLFMEHLFDENFEPCQLFKQKHLARDFNIFQLNKNNPPAINNYLRYKYVSALETMRTVRLRTAFSKLNPLQILESNQPHRRPNSRSPPEYEQHQPNFNIPFPPNQFSSSSQYQTFPTSQSSYNNKEQNSVSSNIEQLESEILGVVNSFPEHIIQFIHSNLERYLPLLTNPSNFIYLFIQQYPGEEHGQHGIDFFKKQVIDAYQKEKKNIFHANQRLVDTKQQQSSSYQNQAELEYEISFDEVSDCQLHYIVSPDVSVNDLQSVIQIEVNSIRSKQPPSSQSILGNILNLFSDQQSQGYQSSQGNMFNSGQGIFNSGGANYSSFPFNSQSSSQSSSSSSSQQQQYQQQTKSPPPFNNSNRAQTNRQMQRDLLLELGAIFDGITGRGIGSQFSESSYDQDNNSSYQQTASIVEEIDEPKKEKEEKQEENEEEKEEEKDKEDQNNKNLGVD